jgi:hypothetical protein
MHAKSPATATPAGRFNDRIANRVAAIDDGIANGAAAINDGITDRIPAIDDGVANRTAEIDHAIANRAAAIDDAIANRAAAIGDGIAERAAAIGDGIADRVATIDDAALERELDAQGFCAVESLLAPAACDALAALYLHDEIFRSRVVMASHGFGRGEYKYFAYPLPDLVARLRTRLYPHLVAIANRWSAELGLDVRYPDDHAGFVARCHAAGQLRPTPLLLAYAEGDYNCLHQDLYGEHVFPLQVAILLSAPDRDFTGGEFVMTEQRPRMQSRPMVVPLRKGDAVVFAVHHRPVHGRRGVYRVNLRHGVSRVRSGARHTLGIIFHDAS